MILLAAYVVGVLFYFICFSWVEDSQIVPNWTPVVTVVSAILWPLINLIILYCIFTDKVKL